MFKAIRAIPYIRLVMIAQVALLAREHARKLTPIERNRLWELVRKARDLTPAERSELRGLAGKLEPAAFARGATRHFSPIGGKRRFGR